MDDIHVVIGVSGALGSAVAHVLYERGYQVRGISRRGYADVPKGVEVVKADMTDPASLNSALEGAVVVYNCVNLPYNHWKNRFIPLTRNFIELMSGRDIPIVVADNLYMYPEDAKEPLHEDMPYGATTTKGKVRAQMAEMYLQAHQEGKIQVVLARGPDFYGPRATVTSYYGNMLFANALRGKKVSVFGNPSMPHQIIYVMDFARAMVTLGEDPTSYGRAWHCPSAPALPQKEFVSMVFREIGRPVKLGSIPKFALLLAGIFNKILAEIVEMYYEFTKPYLVSADQFLAKYDFEVTPHEVAIRETIEWFRQNLD